MRNLPYFCNCGLILCYSFYIWYRCSTLFFFLFWQPDRAYRTDTNTKWQPTRLTTAFAGSFIFKPETFHAQGVRHLQGRELAGVLVTPATALQNLQPSLTRAGRRRLTRFRAVFTSIFGKKLHYTDNVTDFERYAAYFGQKSHKNAPVFKNIDKIHALMISMELEAYLMAMVVMVADGTLQVTPF